MQRWHFQRELEKFSDRTVIYLAEGGVDHRLDREFGRAPRGERIYEAIPGKRRERTSILGAFRHGKLVAPLAFQGRCHPAGVEVYFARGLLPALPPGSVIVLDHASFHHSPTTQRLVAEAGFHRLFWSAYSPDLNPVEHFWATLKSRLRKDLPTAANPFLFITKMCLCYC